MAWLTDGTVSVASGSDAVVGIGTSFQDAMVGSIIQFDDGTGVLSRPYEITAITDALNLTISPDALASYAGKPYVIIPISFTLALDAVTRLGDLITRFGGTLAVAGNDRIVTLDKAGTGDLAAVIFKTAGGNKGRIGLLGDDTIRMQRWDGAAWQDTGSLVARGEWNGTDTYSRNDLVTLSSVIYVAIAPSVNKSPDTETAYWAPFPVTSLPGTPGADGTDGTDGTDGAPGAGYGGTSTTSLTIATGSKAFTTQAGLAYVVGSRVRAASAADPTNFMEGVVASYSSTTLTLTVDLIGGSGTKADWNLSIAGERGAAGADGLGVPGGGTTGQVLAKVSGANNDTEWADPATGSGDIPSRLMIATVADAVALTPLADPDFIQTAGYTAIGDDGGALYKKVGSEPSHAGKFQITSSGSWYELTNQTVTPEMFGAAGDNATDDSGAINNAISFQAARNGGVVQLGVKTYLSGSTAIAMKSGVKLLGFGFGSNVTGYVSRVRFTGTGAAVVNANPTAIITRPVVRDILFDCPNSTTGAIDAQSWSFFEIADNWFALAGSSAYGVRVRSKIITKNITGITKANPGVVTAAGHGFANGTPVYLDGIGGMTALNDTFAYVASATTDTFELHNSSGANINTSAMATYTSGGTAAWISTDPTYGRITGNQITGALYGVILEDNANSISVRNNRIQPIASGTAVHISSAFSTFPNNIDVSANWIESSAASVTGVYVGASVQGVGISNNRFELHGSGAVPWSLVTGCTEVMQWSNLNAASGVYYPLEVISGTGFQMRLAAGGTGVSVNSVLDAGSGGQANFVFGRYGTTKWQFGLLGDDTCYLYDNTNSQFVFQTDASGNFNFGVPLGLKSYAKASLPSATPAGRMIYVSDETGGATPAFSDGTNWRRVADRAVVA